MAKTFTTMVGLQNYLESACETAVRNTANILLEELKNYIKTDYYDLYEPEVYKRTWKFLNSATAKMLGKTSASIGIDEAFMNYEYPATYGNPDGTKGHWTGEDQAYMADAGFHGNVNIYTDGHFFKDFLQYCDKNATKILKNELKKQGLTVK